MRYHDLSKRLLSATWSPLLGVRVVHSDLPEPWTSALSRLGRDLRVRQYGNGIEHVDWEIDYDPEIDGVFLLSAVTVAGVDPGQFGGSWVGTRVDSDEEFALWAMADSVQDVVADLGTAWPWGDDGGFMSARLVDGVAMWKDRNGCTMRIGDLVGIV
ncbi:hypothetical protein CH251_14060 [Rhodococcus sp. 06-462-5]|uniref:hypothetical protein n=1 Tax=unclassified Rhodococcus (in: high G+C Gram-positive bacteria) TaxID=192944 RepID=UPI000B9A8E2C|nr:MULTISPECIES: hypothetical protein [unclassified Rhodococcus (in: high G+C Gram-positive bacteria)]OZC73652.1 hypothetical protein CH251_14060 [Rhodococcus sp. 06-462-5]OZE63461.1 hypothetical protein CH270_18435 [Rhodococcus sp. 02-925g]